MTEVERIAKGLSEAQRRLLLHNTNGFVLLVRGWARFRLRKKGLIEPFLSDYFGNAAWQPTDLGLQVRAYLEKDI